MSTGNVSSCAEEPSADTSQYAVIRSALISELKDILANFYQDASAVESDNKVQLVMLIESIGDIFPDTTTNDSDIPSMSDRWVRCAVRTTKISLLERHCEMSGQLDRMSKFYDYVDMSPNEIITTKDLAQLVVRVRDMYERGVYHDDYLLFLYLQQFAMMPHSYWISTDLFIKHDVITRFVSKRLHRHDYLQHPRTSANDTAVACEMLLQLTRIYNAPQGWWSEEEKNKINAEWFALFSLIMTLLQLHHLASFCYKLSSSSCGSHFKDVGDILRVTIADIIDWKLTNS